MSKITEEEIKKILPLKGPSFEEVEKRVTSDFLLEIAIASAKLKAQNHMRIGPSIFEDINPTSPFRRSGVGLDNSDDV